MTYAAKLSSFVSIFNSLEQRIRVCISVDEVRFAVSQCQRGATGLDVYL